MAGFVHRIRAFWRADDLIALQAERDKLARLLSEAETRVTRLERAVEAREHFITVVGHEMRNPMAPIMLGIERLSQLVERGDYDRVRAQI
ncbi:MAG TPA: hypothetical protein VL574_13505, partial [Stellaceae bacterium]|nr:hypothetical protein [Stellaceae bacterium]